MKKQTKNPKRSTLKRKADLCYLCGEPVTEAGILERGGGRIGFDAKKDSYYHGYCVDKLTKEET